MKLSGLIPLTAVAVSIFGPALAHPKADSSKWVRTLQEIEKRAVESRHVQKRSGLRRLQERQVDGGGVEAPEGPEVPEVPETPEDEVADSDELLGDLLTIGPVTPIGQVRISMLSC
jgi:hypothetical protein